ncbi:hypothetical protein LUZ63_001516 [Rhynchospora breviuscula]|uniref:Pentatricopeptide repeat-containing protein n=1 Tax=Rhynchospora breviuscula TaxID=2022672 RepID=A0A9Q0CXX9_9POAL|nr:hypothetical protein LUZ63_001516 [Rhynchospora breviuscula]
MLVRFPGPSSLGISLRLRHLITSSLSSSLPLPPHRHFSPQPYQHFSLCTNHPPDTASLLQFIQTLRSSGRSEEAHRRLLLLLLSSSTAYTNQSYNALLSSLLKSNSPLLTLRLILRLSHVKPFNSLSLSTFNKLIHLLCNCFLGHAHRLLLRLQCVGPLPDTATYTIVLNGYASLGDFGAARRLFDEMLEYNVFPNLLTRSVLIKAALRKRAYLSEGSLLMEQFWLEMQKEKDERGLEESVRNAAFANLIQCLCHEALFHEVFRISEEMPQGDSVREEFAFSQMIDSLCRYSQFHSAVKIVHRMEKGGFKPSSVSYNCIIHGLCLSGDCIRAYQLLKEGDNFGYTLPEVTYKALVESLCRKNDIAKAKDVLEFMLARAIDTETKTRFYNIFLSALQIVQNSSEQLDVLVRMLEKQCQPDIITLNTIIHGFCKVGKVNEARKIMDDMINGTFSLCVPDVVTFTMIICGLLDAGQCDEALDLLRSMVPKHSCPPNTVTYNATIKGLFGLKKVEKALEVFDEMLRKRIPCDSLTYTYIIKGLFEADRIEKAKRFWDDVIWPSKRHDEFVYSAFLRGFCQAEKFDQACDFLYKLVDKGVNPGVVNYNILIDYACKKGLKRNAYFILNQMKTNGLEPDAVTWRTLNQLHHHQDKPEMVVSPNCNNDREVQELVTNSKEIDDDNLLHLELDESMEGFADPSLSTEQVEGTSHVPEDVNFSKHSGHNAKEPLSTIARRVFGL